MNAPNEALRELTSILGEEEAKDLIRSFLAEFPDMLRTLATAEPVECKRIAHSLKSTARHMGADSLSRRMAALEARLSTPKGRVTQDDLIHTAEEFEKAAALLRPFAAARDRSG